jgi:hypothetical protein
MSLAPSILYGVFNVNNAGLNGLTVAALCGPAAIAAAVLGRFLTLSLCAAVGAIAMVVGLGVLIMSLLGGGVVVFFIGTLIAGVGFGVGVFGLLDTSWVYLVALLLVALITSLTHWRAYRDHQISTPAVQS